MSRQGRKKSKPQNKPQILPMVLIGAGLLILGVLGFAMLPKLGAAANSNDGAAKKESGPSAVPVAVDFDAPELALKDLQGNPVALADFRHQVVLVNNWATWCPPCKAEMPTLQAYFDDHKHQDFTIIAIEAGNPSTEVARFKEEYGLSFHVWPDIQQKAMEAFRNMSLPSSYVIDKSGKVRLAWTGAISREMLEQYVTPILEE